jgi:hypothetical protein
MADTKKMGRLFSEAFHDPSGVSRPSSETIKNQVTNEDNNRAIIIEK